MVPARGAGGARRRYIRTGNYARILTQEAQLQRSTWGHFQTQEPHALDLLDAPPAAAAGAASKEDGKKAAKGAGAGAGAGARPAALNVGAVQWPHVQEPGAIYRPPTTKSAKH
jgi:hypothetical protein